MTHSQTLDLEDHQKTFLKIFDIIKDQAPGKRGGFFVNRKLKLSDKTGKVKTRQIFARKTST